LSGIAVASAQATAAVVRISHGIPTDLKAITQLESSLQSKAMKLAVQNGYKPNKDWEDTVKYWTDDGKLRAVSFINSSYEYTTVVFNNHGKWLQTTRYLNPEFTETSKIMESIEDKGYYVYNLTSPIGPIIKYHTLYDTWYEADAYETKAPPTIVSILLNKRFQFMRVKK
jgi:hypothetical protein